MNVLFLDIDGVLVTEQVMRNTVKTITIVDKKFDASAVQVLKEIIDEYNFKVVLSSAWRLFPSNMAVVGMLLDKIDSYIYDITPNFHTYSFTPLQRHDEIADWISKNPVDKFIILDDDPMAKYPNNHVRTSWTKALSNEDKEKVRAIMER